MKITQEVRALAIEQAGRRCECTGANCRHHLRGARCKHGLRGDEWKLFWRTESGGTARSNIEAWCLECFDNNFEVPRETVALFSPEIAGYDSLAASEQRTAVTLRSVLRDAAARSAGQRGGRMVLDRLDDDVLLELPCSASAVDTARNLRSLFEEMTLRLALDAPPLCGAIHRGEVSRWRNGFLAGDAVEVTAHVRSLAAPGQVLLTDAAAAPIEGQVEVRPFAPGPGKSLTPPQNLWALDL